MNWLLWVFLSIIAISVERVINRKILANTDRYWDYLVGYNAGAVIFLVVVAAPIQFPLLSWTTTSLLLVSGALWFVSCALSFKADQLAEISLTSLLAQLQLVLIFAGGVVLFGEPISASRLFGLCLILLGLSCRQFLSSFFSKGVLFKLASIVMLSVALLLDKYLSSTLEASLVTFSGFGIPLLLSLLLQPRRSLSAFQYAKRLRFGNFFTGALSCLSYFALVKSMAIAPISLVMPVFQLNLMITLILGYFFLGEKQDLIARLGAVLLVLLGAIVIQC